MKPIYIYIPFMLSIATACMTAMSLLAIASSSWCISYYLLSSVDASMHAIIVAD